MSRYTLDSVQYDSAHEPPPRFLKTGVTTMEHRFGGDWTDDKLQRLSKYLRAYMTIFKTNEAARYFQTTYVDAFAGTGYRSRAGQPSEMQSMFADEDASSFVKGSASIALECEPPFDRYIFVDRSADYATALEHLRTRYDARNIAIHRSDANSFLTSWCRTTDWKTNRAVVFLDPYGMEVEWSTIEQIAGTRAIDLWWLFPPIHRLLPNRGPESKWSAALTRTFGTNVWEQTFYRSGSRRSLFGVETDTQRTADIDTIARFIVGRLRTIFAGVAPKPRVLLNSKNVPIYLLCFAAANPKGARTAIKIAKHILEQ